MEILDIVKTNLRLDTDAFDEAELQVLIEACSKDLVLAGVSEERSTEYTDPLIARAVVLYCKANFGFDDKAERYDKAYQMHKNSLALAGDYNG